MDLTTQEAIIKLLPDPITYVGDECYHYTTHINKEKDKIEEVRVRFKKDDTGKKWVYIDAQVKKDSA